jgi:hypothetical protein
LEIGDYEVLRTRNTGRGGVAPYAQTFGDCNPGPPNHWIIEREKAGPLKLLHSKHEDNPSLYDDKGRLTEQGVKTMAVLDSLTGLRYKRLRLGLWVAAEGTVYEGWDRSVHLIDHVPGHPEWTKDNLPKSWRRWRAIDFGFTNPFVTHWWAMDEDGRLYLYRELYGTQRLVEDWAVDIKRYSVMRSDTEEGEGTGDHIPERIEDTIADHDAEDRATLHRRGIWTTAAVKDVSPGIQAVQERLKIAGDGKPRLYIFRGALVGGEDTSLREKRKPTCTADEMDTYVWQESKEGKAEKEEPLKVDDHGMDAMRYMVYHLDGIGNTVIETNVRVY